jgi:organic radical activating enzyme
VFEKKNTYFPIKKDPACQLKWNWSTLYLSYGFTSSCHRCSYIPLTVENFENFHNLPEKIKEREIMLDGKWPTIENGGSGSCNSCKNVEDTGGMSDRLHHLTIPNQTPVELLSNSTETKVTPKILELYVNNTCNLKCTYCQPMFSSQWESETKKFGSLYKINGEKIKPYDSIPEHKDAKIFFEKSMDWLLKNGNQLKKLNLLGGEIFFQSEFKEILKTLEKLKNKDLELSIVSNLMVKEEIYKDYIEQIKKLCKDRKIGRLDLTCSIDGWGEEAEYARFGLKLDSWQKIFEYTVDQKWIYININQVINNLTMKTIYKLIEVINNYRRKRPINHHITFVTGREWLHPKIYGKDFWQNDIVKILEIMPTDNQRNIISKKFMSGLLNSLPNRDPDYEQIKNLKFFLDQLDKRRNTDWRKIFSYLDI